MAAVDLLAPGVGEICGGSLREERFDVLQQSLDKTSFNQTLSWSVFYDDAFIAAAAAAAADLC